MTNVVPFFRGVIVGVNAIWITYSDGSVLDGYEVQLRNHPAIGSVRYWQGLTLAGALMEAHALIAVMPGATLEVSQDHGGDDPDGGNFCEVAA